MPYDRLVIFLAACLASCDASKGPIGSVVPVPPLKSVDAGPPRPHVVLLILDTLRADALGCYGGGLPASPEIDALAGRGVRFDRVVSQTSWTRPSVGSLLTSRYPRSLGIHRVQEGALGLEEVTLAEVLQGEGYRTVGATANPHLNPIFGFHQGFDEYLESGAVWNWMGEEPGDREETGANAALASARQIFQRVLLSLREEETQKRQQPHYLQLDVMDVHEHFPVNHFVRPEFQDLFPGLKKNPPQRLYFQALRQLSTDVGWFLEELRSIPGFEDVLMVLVSDHGEGLESHPSVAFSRTHGRLLYESQILVPWILYHTGSLFAGGRVVEDPVRLLDVMPTLLDILRIDGPAGMRGVSLWPTIRTGRPADLPAAFVVETYAFKSDKIGVYGPQFKYIENRDQHEGLPDYELQPNGRKEAGARTDQSGRHADLVTRFRNILSRWEDANPVEPPRALLGGPEEDTFELLKALGYTDG